MTTTVSLPPSRTLLALAGVAVELQTTQPGVHTVELEQLVVGAIFGNDAVLDDDDFVGAAQGA